jgi:ATP-dependent RNA helicase DDX60
MNEAQIFSFVLEERFGLDSRESLPASLWDMVQDSAAELEDKLGNRVSQVPLVPLHVTPPDPNGLDQFLKDVLGHLVSHVTESPPLFWELTSLFFLHIMILPSLPISARARHREDLSEDLVAMLVQTFLPQINTVMTAFVLTTNRFVDIDGRIFATVLRYTTSHGHLQSSVLPELAGSDISSRLETVWRLANAPLPDFTELLASFPHSHEPELSSASSDEDVTSYSLLPFQNQVFDDELAAVHVTVSDQSPSSSAVLEFSQDIPFSDTRHWHAHRRTILPRHLGGEAMKPIDKRLRQKQLRRDQRFMIHMQRLAATLTGASGKVLQQILIPPTGRKVSEITGNLLICKAQRDKKVCWLTTAYLCPLRMF